MHLFRLAASTKCTATYVGLILVLLSLLMYSCDENSHGNKANPDDDKPEKHASRKSGRSRAYTSASDATEAVEAVEMPDVSYANVKEVVNDRLDSKWSMVGPTGQVQDNYLSFDGDSLGYFYLTHCAYRYPIKIFDDEIVMFWEPTKYCEIDLNLEKQNGILNAPKYGEAFCAYSLSSAKSLKVVYFYPEWCKKIESKNPNYKTFFPTELRRE